jgi:hypothetical protein
MPGLISGINQLMQFWIVLIPVCISFRVYCMFPINDEIYETANSNSFYLLKHKALPR